MSAFHLQFGASLEVFSNIKIDKIYEFLLKRDLLEQVKLKVLKN